MNKNKGFIGLGLILVIVLGVAVVGGGAYYLGKSSNKLEVIKEENLPPNTENKNLPIVENKVKDIPEETGEYGDDKNGRHIGYIKKIDEKNNLSIDYVQWISPCAPDALDCQNGFKTKNSSNQLRVFPVLDNVQIKLQTYGHDSSGGLIWNQVVSFSVFKTALNVDLLYWITLKDGKVVEITEQYQA